MKKVVIAVLCVGFSAQANATFDVYLRAAATGALTNSDFNVDGTVRVGGTEKDLSVIRHKNHAIRNIGVRVSAGLQTKLDYNWFFGGELNWFMDRTKHDHDFIDNVDHLDLGFGDERRISYVNIKSKDELGFAFRFGKDFITEKIISEINRNKFKKFNDSLKNHKLNTLKECFDKIKKTAFDNQLKNALKVPDSFRERIHKKIITIWKENTDKLARKNGANTIIKNWIRF